MKLFSRPSSGLIILFILVGLFTLLAGSMSLSAQELQPEEPPAFMTDSMKALWADREPPQDLEAMSATPCVGGMAGSYPCDNVDLLAFMPLGTIGGGSGNDSWGWTDSVTGKEYALMGRSSGTSFIDITDPENPVYLGNLPTHTSSSLWRDIKVYADHAFVVSEASGHGMQVFDLTQLRNVTNPPVTFSETAHYSGFSGAHNVVINEDSGYAYAVGTNTCSGGLHMVDISTPTSPTGAGCFSSDGYTHDAQCVNYVGPDPDHQGSEICFNSNEDTLTIVDVTNKAAPVQLSRTSYSGSGYTHQGWLTADQQYFLLDDELDELNFGHNTRTRVFDVSNLDSPASFVGYHNGRTPSIDHNMYVHNGLAYQANYRSGLTVLDIAGVATATLTDVGYFDIYPANDNPGFDGAWNVYPFHSNGVITVSGIGEGLFILRLQPEVALDIAKSQPAGTLQPGETITYTIAVSNTGSLTATNVVVTDTLNGVPTVLSGADSIDPGQDALYSFNYVINQADCGTTLSNTASASADSAATVTLAVPVETNIVCMTPLRYFPWFAYNP